jgi:hypothetical protein
MKPRSKPLATSFCHCIKKVRSTVTLRKNRAGNKNKQSAKESAAIAICVKSVLQTRGKTLKKFTCKKKPYLKTQPLRTN